MTFYAGTEFPFYWVPAPGDWKQSCPDGCWRSDYTTAVRGKVDAHGEIEARVRVTDYSGADVCTATALVTY